MKYKAYKYLLEENETFADLITYLNKISLKKNKRLNLYHADLRYADLYHADLYNADLHNADLRHADLRHANLEFSCLPLSCCSENIKIDKNNMQKLLKIIFTAQCDWKEFITFKKMKIFEKLIGG